MYRDKYIFTAAEVVSEMERRVILYVSFPLFFFYVWMKCSSLLFPKLLGAYRRYRQ